MRTVSYKSAGTGHDRCEDSTYVISDSSGVSAALADGMGSAKFAADGSKTVSEAAAGFFAQYLDRVYGLTAGTIADGALEIVRRKLLKTAGSIGCDVAELSSTLISLAFTHDGKGLLMHIGDGCVIGLRPNGTTEVISRYTHKGYVNQTDFVTTPSPEIKAIKLDRNSYCAYLLCSDGPEGFLIANDKPIGFVQRLLISSLFLSVEDIADTLTQCDRFFREKGQHDDASYIIVVPENNSSELIRNMPDELLKAIFTVGNDSRHALAQMVDKLLSSPDGASVKDLTGLSKRKKKLLDTLMRSGRVKSCNNKYYYGGFENE